MIGYVIRRLLGLIPVVWGLGTVVFFMQHLLPGDPVQIMLGFAYNERSAAVLRESLGLNDPLWEQYLRYWWNLLQGDMGRSMQTRVPVMEMITAQFPATLTLSLAGMGFAVLLGGVLGLIAAVKVRTWFDSGTMVLALVGISIPSFWLGLLLILVFSVGLSWFPITGQGGLNRLVLPAIAVGLPQAAIIARLVRSSMLEVLGADYLTTARAKGVAERAVIMRHALRNALVPVVTVVGLQFGALMGGTVVIENVFAREGLGRLTVQSIMLRDIPVVQGAVLFLGVTYVLVNLVVDLCYSWLDPRIRVGAAK